jgi:hypothetical protein
MPDQDDDEKGWGPFATKVPDPDAPKREPHVLTDEERAAQGLPPRLPPEDPFSEESMAKRKWGRRNTRRRR